MLAPNIIEPVWRLTKDPRFQTGASIPYLLGALRDPIGADAAPEEGKQQLRELLAAMEHDVPPPRSFQVLWCPKIKAHVVKGWEEAKGFSHCAIDGYDIRDVDSLADALWDLYQKPILNCTFSRRFFSKWKQPDWDTYNADDLHNIKNARTESVATQISWRNATKNSRP